MIVVIGAVAAPIFLSYAGLDPTPRTGDKAYPQLQGYVARRTPGQGINHGIDFSQLWLSARHIAAGEKVYYPVERKTWRREWSSTYHPLTHWLYLPLGQLSFKNALVTHNVLGIALLLLCGGLAMRAAGCLAAYPSAVAATQPVAWVPSRSSIDVFSASSRLMPC